MNRSLQMAKKESWKLFDQIAGTYDLVNSLISLGADRFWRQQLVQKIIPKPQMQALDLATGTADTALLLAKQDYIKQVEGIDLSRKMIALGRKKVQCHGHGKKITLARGDAVALTRPDHSFDLVTLVFGVRNFSNASQSLSHIYRVLRPGGQVLIMEFGLPQNRLLKLVYLFYLRNVLPLVGSIISRHPFAYRYLNRTVESFPYGDRFVPLLESAGFKAICTYPLFFGVTYIYSGTK